MSMPLTFINPSEPHAPLRHASNVHAGAVATSVATVNRSSQISVAEQLERLLNPRILVQIP
jgi:hypothetical protein